MSREPLVTRALQMIENSSSLSTISAARFLDTFVESFTTSDALTVLQVFMGRLRRLGRTVNRELPEVLVLSVCRFLQKHSEISVGYEDFLIDLLPHVPLRTTIADNVVVFAVLLVRLPYISRIRKDVQQAIDCECLRLIAWFLSRSMRDFDEMKKGNHPYIWLTIRFMICGQYNSLCAEVENSQDVIREALNNEEFRIARLQENLDSQLGIGEEYPMDGLPLISLGDLSSSP
jgi:hypothetical protein